MRNLAATPTAKEMVFIWLYNSNGLQTKCNGLQPNSDGLHLRAMASKAKNGLCSVLVLTTSSLRTYCCHDSCPRGDGVNMQTASMCDYYTGRRYTTLIVNAGHQVSAHIGVNAQHVQGPSRRLLRLEGHTRLGAKPKRLAHVARRWLSKAPHLAPLPRAKQAKFILPVAMGYSKGWGEHGRTQACPLKKKL